MVGTLRRAKLHHRVEFRRNQSNRGRDIAIFRFFKMAAAAILDNQNFKFLTVGGSQYVAVPNFVEIGQTGAEIWRFFDFSKMEATAVLDF